MFVRPLVNLRSKSAVTAVLKLPVAKKHLLVLVSFSFYGRVNRSHSRHAGVSDYRWLQEVEPEPQTL